MFHAIWGIIIMAAADVAGEAKVLSSCCSHLKRQRQCVPWGRPGGGGGGGWGGNVLKG